MQRRREEFSPFLNAAYDSQKIRGVLKDRKSVR
jgi:hypothetical protein